MRGPVLRKYGEATTINFQLFEVDGVDLRVDAVHAAGDSVIMKDEGAEANTASGFTDEGNGYSLALSATEMQAARIVVYLIDQTATKVWLDDAIVIETYGNASAQHAFDLDTATAAADVVSISGDTTAADNLELMYDGTGYTDDTAPASRAQVSGIGSTSGGSVNFPATEDNTGGAIIDGVTFVGTVDSGTFASTETEDGTPHQISDAANVIDLVYGFDVGGSRIATSANGVVNVDGNTDEILLKVYDHVGADWETLTTISGTGGTAYAVFDVPLFQKHTGTGGELGKVYLRYDTDSTTPSLLQVDRQVVAAVISGTSIGYVDGAVWLDTSASNTNTESFVDGTADNPVSTIAAAITIAGNLNLKILQVLPGSAITFAAAMDNYKIMGRNYTIAFGGQSCANTFIEGATLSGTWTGAGLIMEDCIINAITGPGATMRRCFFNDVTMTNNGTAGWNMNDCRSRVAGTSSPNFDFGAAVANTALNMRNYMGGIEIENIGGAGTDTMSIDGMGQMILNANCAGGTIAMRGIFSVTDNASGAVSLIRQDPTVNEVHQGTAQGGSANTITLAATASATDGQYDPGEVLITTGPGAGESRSILDYNGTTKVATIGKDWRTNPTSASSYVVLSATGNTHVNEGAAQAGASNSITLNSAASATDGIYNGQTVFILGGTGQDQARKVIAYNGTTKVAIVNRPWQTNPASGSSYVMLPDSEDAADIAVQTTTIATLASQTSFTLSAGSSDDDAYNNWAVAVIDQSTAEQRALGIVNDYTGSTKTVTLRTDPAIFTMAAGDTVVLLPAFLSEFVEVNVKQIDDDAQAAANLEASTETIVTGTAQTGTLSTTQMSTDLSEATDDHYIGRTVIWRTGALATQASDITDYAGTNGVLTFTAVTEAPSNGDTFVIV